MSQVLVLDTEWKPCTPVPPGRARHLLTAKRAALFRRSPVTLILKAGERCEGVQSLRLKIDPGSTATGRQSRQMCRTDAFGFPDNAATATSVVGGLRTGDMVRAMVPASRVKSGAYGGRIAVRATDSCTIKTAKASVQGIHCKYCQPLHRGDGYRYLKGDGASSPGLKTGVSAPEIR